MLTLCALPSRVMQGVMCPKLIWKMKKVQSAKFVRKKRIYLKAGAATHPFLWIEFLDDGSFSLGFMSKQVKLTEYGSAIQRGSEFTRHAQVVRRGNITIDETEAPHYTFHQGTRVYTVCIRWLTAIHGIGRASAFMPISMFIKRHLPASSRTSNFVGLLDEIYNFQRDRSTVCFSVCFWKQPGC